MQLDVGSLFLALTINMATMAAALPAVMGRRDRAARRSQGAIGLQAAGFALLLLSTLTVRGGPVDRLLSTLSMGSLACSLAVGASAFGLWCGRPGRQPLMFGLAFAVPLGYVLGFGSYEFRVGWANGLMALQMAVLAVQLGRRQPRAVGLWRWMLVAMLAVQAGATASRGVLGVFFSDVFPRFNAPHPVNIGFALVALMSNVLTLVCILLAHRERASRELERLASVDGLTGVLNRRAWLAQAQAVMAQAPESPVAVVMIDVDHFKRINDTLGHDAGDRALKVVAEVLRRTARGSDLVGRYGGEEFCVLMKDATHAGAAAFDRRLRDALGGQAQQVGAVLSYSAGIAMRAGDGTDTLAALLQRADAMLYRAKAAGRDTTLSESGPLMRVA